MKKGEIQWAGFWLAGLLCVVLTAVKLVFALPWSWWRVLLPLWVVLWHNSVYMAVGFIWLTWMGCGREGDDLRVRQHRKLDRYQLGSMVCAVIFVDNVLRKMGGPGESVWWWLASGRQDVLMLSGGSMLACQFLYLWFANIPSVRNSLTLRMIQGKNRGSCRPSSCSSFASRDSCSAVMRPSLWRTSLSAFNSPPSSENGSDLF